MTQGQLYSTIYEMYVHFYEQKEKCEKYVQKERGDSSFGE